MNTPCKKYNSAMFEEFYLNYYPKVMGFTLAMVKSHSVAEDLTHDIFARLWERKQLLDEVELIEPYLYRMTKNTALNYLQRKYKISQPLSENIEDSGSIEESYYAKEKALLIDLVVGSMPEKRRRVFELSRYKGLKNSQIALMMQISEKTVEWHLAAAIKELKEALIIMVVMKFFV